MSSNTPVDRVYRSKDVARESYNALSRLYDVLSGGVERRCRERGLCLFAPREGERVLAPRGRICVVGMSAEGEGGFVSSCYRFAHRHFERLVDCRPIRVERCLAEAGFATEVKELHRMCGLPVEIVLSRKGGA